MHPYVESSLASLALDVDQAAKVIVRGDTKVAAALLRHALTRLEEIEQFHVRLANEAKNKETA